MAGTGKRGDARKPGILKTKRYFGKHGFTAKNTTTPVTINVQELDALGTAQVNLKELGYTKLLGKGKATKKYVIMVEYATPKAIKKIEQAGGKVTLGEKG